MFKIFGTDGIRCRVNDEPMTPDTCLKIAKTVGFLLSNKDIKKHRVIISKDTRLSGYLFEPLMTSGFVSMGMDVILTGPLPTPALSMLITSLRADMGVMITASHNTYEYNGLKFFDSNGNKISKLLEKQIEDIVKNEKKYKKISNKGFSTGKATRFEDTIGRYSEYLKLSIRKKTKFKNIKVVLDCANGATYQIAPNIFWELGCDVVAIGNQPNGKNINAQCGAVNVKSLSKKVLETNADIGFAYDGDGDRLIIIDEKGQTIDGDKIIALITKEFLSKNRLNKNTVVTTVMSNLGFENFLKETLGVKLIRTNVGDINVIKEMQENSYSLGGEQSGHIIMSDYSKTGDGILVSLKILEILEKSNLKSSKLFDIYRSYSQEKIDLPLLKKLDKKMNENIKKLYLNCQKNNSHLRYLIRESGTEPLLRLLVEGRDTKEVKKAMQNLSNNIKEIINV
tara:strand:- start:14534 stop:15892 length:1359 start_codon:yes stop_codon:yes gene_type:complete